MTKKQDKTPASAPASAPAAAPTTAATAAPENKGQHALGKIEKPSVITYSDALDKFSKDLSPATARNLTEAVHFIVETQQKMVENVLAIGDKLNGIRSWIGAEKFGEFMVSVLPRLGISKATGYRWMGLAAKLQQVFPNPAVRGAILAHTDGRGIIVQDEQDKTKVSLTPAFTAAMKKLGPAPKGTADKQGAETYALQLITVARKERRDAQQPGNGKAAAESKVVKAFMSFAKKYGTEDAEKLIGKLDKVLTTMDEEAETAAPKKDKSAAAA